MSSRPDKVVVRDREWVMREYDREKWPEVLATITAIVEEGDVSLSLAVARAARCERSSPRLNPRRVTLLGRPLEMPVSFAWGGHYAAIMEEIIAACGSDTDCVVELGSGWGRNLFDLWLAGGPREAAYIACEITEAGRQCSRRLAALEPALDFKVLPFDFRDPDLTDIPGGKRKYIVFTVHSIEQIPCIEPAVFQKILGLGPAVEGLHFEPVGWQFRAETDSSGRNGSSPAYAEKNDYNRNLWRVLEALANAGQIEILSAKPDVIGINPENSTSFIHWRARKS